ncbi:kinase-like domain-containing protein [Endogone sp. FLAS-F59071]|nr:kinase-like domain-containing protein [Endogone sp. FLAS-F59071]|eukprot:RUS16591.1 kinase-like domain-containing protein [Endogone sp. FLAS-F59071]
MPQTQLQLTKALLKPCYLLSDFVQDNIKLWKSRFPDDQELKCHLGELGILELSDFLVWVPFEKLTELRLIGEGGFSKVWWAQIPECGNRQVALKEMNQILIQEVIMTTIISCQTLTSTVSSTASIRGLSIHPESGKYLMVLDYLKGGNMEERCKNTIPKSWDEIIEMADCLALNLADIHELGLTHNDLHPGNVMFYDSIHNRNYIIDIGLGKAISKACNTETSNDGCYGRMEYFPPEIFLQKPYTRPSDVYCFATLVWQLISRVRPRGTAVTPPKQNVHSFAREELVPGTPVELQKIICDCWNPDPNKRPTMREVHSRLLKARSGLGVLGEETLAFITKRRDALEVEGSSFTFIVTTQSQYFNSNQLAKFTQETATISVPKAVSKAESATSIPKMEAATSVSKEGSAATSVSKAEPAATTEVSKAESATSISKVESAAASVYKGESSTTSVSKAESVAASVSKAESAATNVSKAESDATSIFKAASLSKGESSTTSVSKMESTAISVSKAESDVTTVSKVESATNVFKVVFKAESATSISKVESATASVYKGESSAASVSKEVSKAESAASISKVKSAAASVYKGESSATSVPKEVSKAESATNVSKAESAASISKVKSAAASVYNKGESSATSVSKVESATSVSKAESAISAAASVSREVSKAESATSASKESAATINMVL